MNLIILAPITTAPRTDSLMLRFLVQNVKTNLHINVLLEAERGDIDYYFNYLKNKGCFDYVDEILPAVCKEDGIRLNKELNYPKTILCNHVDWSNVRGLLGQIQFLSKI